MRNILLSLSMMILLIIGAIAATTVLDTNRHGNKKKSGTIVDSSRKTESDTDTRKSMEGNLFSSHLPIVLIETSDQSITKAETIWAKVTVIDNENGKNYLDDKYNFQTPATLKYRGSSSFKLDKKQFRLEFFEKKEGTKKNDIPVMGMPEDSDWVLNGPFIDRTLIRDSLLYNVSRQILDWSPDTRYCEVFLDGMYRGVYLMTESVKVSRNRINLKDFSLITGETAYMLQREKYGTEENVINTFGTYSGKTYHELSTIYPTKQKIMDTHKEWIRKDISEFERVLYSNMFNDTESGYSKYIDVDSFVDYYIINEFALIKDSGYLSTITYKDLGGKLKMTVWDFNNAFDNYYSPPIGSNEFCANNNWFKRLLQDRNFVQKVVNRYHELRKGVLSEEYFLKAIDDKVLHLGDSVDRNFNLWGYTFNMELLTRDKEGLSRDPVNYDESIRMLKDEIINRGKFLDENIETLYQYVID